MSKIKEPIYVFKCDPDGDQFTLKELEKELADRLREYTIDDFEVLNEQN